MILVVEGLTDATFFQELLIRLYIQEAKSEYDLRPGRRNIPAAVRGTLTDGSSIEVEFRNQEGKAAIPDVIRGLLVQHVAEITVAQDVDSGSPEDLVESTQQIAHSYFGLQPLGPTPEGQTGSVEATTIQVIPMGLHENQTLTNLGISKHEMEDYLIMLTLEDPGLRQNVPELSSLLANILPTVREFEGDFNSSKELFQLIKPMIQHGFSDTGVVQKLVRDADQDILRSVLAPLLVHVEQAFGI